MTAGVVALGYSAYVQYAALPEDHTFARGSRRVALALEGATLIVVGAQLLP